MLEKWSKWEYWPAYMFYIPILPYWIYLAIKARHPVFFAAANPSILAGGSGFESKYKTIMLIPEKWRPDTVFIPRTNILLTVLDILKATNINYPFIIKPDVGFRGLLVSKIRNESELKIYLEFNILDLIIQEFIDGDTEFGIFYHRVPGILKGKITSLTQKVYLHIVGDGVSTIESLLLKGKIEYHFIEMVIQQNGTELLDTIPPLDKVVILSHIGNHSRGATFLNRNDHITEKLEARIDKINKEIDGWYYGRLDLKAKSIDNLVNGIDIKILEINGVIGEPAHIYDSTIMTYPKALKEIMKHWDYIYDVSIVSKKNGANYFNTFTMLKEIYKLIKHKLMLEKITRDKLSYKN